VLHVTRSLDPQGLRQARVKQHGTHRTHDGLVASLSLAVLLGRVRGCGLVRDATLG
jgi:hypothetical protein